MRGHLEPDNGTERKQAISGTGEPIPTDNERGNVIHVRRGSEGMRDGVEAKVPKEEAGGPPYLCSAAQDAGDRTRPC